MVKSIQALIDLAANLGVALVCAAVLHGLIKLFARRISDIRYFKSLVITVIGALLYGYLGSLKYSLPEWVCALGVYFVVTIVIVVYCFVPFWRALIVALLFVTVSGAAKYGATMGIDRLMPGRWTLEQQTRFAREQIKRSSGGTNTMSIATVMANFMNSVATLLHPGEAQLMQDQMGMGLEKLREMRAIGMMGTNYDELAAMTNENLKYVTPDRPGAGGGADLAAMRAALGAGAATGSVDLAQVTQAFAQIHEMQRGGGVHYADADLRTATSNLMATLRSTNGVQSVRVLGSSMGKMVVEFGTAAGARNADGTAPTTVQATTALVSMASELLRDMPGFSNTFAAAALEHMPTLTDPRWAAIIPTNLAGGGAGETIIDVVRAAELAARELPGIDENNVLTAGDPRWAARVATNEAMRAVLTSVLMRPDAGWEGLSATGELSRLALAKYIAEGEPSWAGIAATDDVARAAYLSGLAMFAQTGAAARLPAAGAPSVAAAPPKPELIPTPPELKVTGFVARGRGNGYVLCNGEIVRLGSEVSIETNGMTLTWRLETVEQKEAMWSRVTGTNDERRPVRTDFR